MLKEKLRNRPTLLLVSTILVALPLLADTSLAAGSTASQSADADLALMKSNFAQQFPGTAPSTATTAAAAPLAIGPSNRSTPYLEENSRVVNTLLSKAKPDECFSGVGVNYPAGPPCSAPAIPKTNQGYVWGLGKSENSLWFGTGANVQCLVDGTYLASTNPVLNSSYVCEFGQSVASRNRGLPAAIGDMRPPHIYKYDITTKTTTDLSSRVTAGVDLTRLQQTVGLRSVGILGNSTTYLAGPSLTGINIFAFNTQSGVFLGSLALTQYTNIRKWLSLGDSVYTGVANRTGGGSVLKFKPAPGNPLAYSIITATIDGEAAELALHKNRIYVSTWPNAGTGGASALHASSIWMSPRISEDGVLSSGSQNVWTKVWTVTQYEADPVTANTYGGGAMFSYQGNLYWGTMHVPFLATAAKWNRYGPAQSPIAAIADSLGTFRATSLFQADDFSISSPRVDLLYGQSLFPVWDPTISNGLFAHWTLRPGAMGAPKYGPSGFGNPFNNYTWSMQEYNKQLFVGTMDWSYLLAQAFPGLLTTAGLNLGNISLPNPATFYGADLWRFKSGTSSATPQSINGVGNYLNYGVRTMASDSRGLYIGTANPMNLMPAGGWELRSITTDD